jgi:hypothetical protein
VITPEQQRQNRRLGWILASVVAVFFFGFVAKLVLLGG